MKLILKKFISWILILLSKSNAIIASINKNQQKIANIVKLNLPAIFVINVIFMMALTIIKLYFIVINATYVGYVGGTDHSIVTLVDAA